MNTLRRNKYALISIVMCFALIFPCVPSVMAADISVYLNGRLLSYQERPQIVNSTVMIPFMSTGFEMGSDVEWDPENGVATVLLGNRYVAVQVGNTSFSYGEYGYDQYGFKKITESQSSMPANPVANYNDILVPAKVFSDGLGASTTTDLPKKTVYLISPNAAPKPTPLPTPAPVATPVPSKSAFTQTPFFEIVSSQKAQSMYNLNDKFILVYYRSDDSNSVNLMPVIKQTAQEQGKRIFAVDMADKYNNTNIFNKLDFIWQFINSNEITLPTVFFVNGKNSVTYYKMPIDNTTLSQKMSAFWTSAPMSTPGTNVNNPVATPRPTPRPVSSSVSATPSPTPIINENLNFVITTIPGVQNMYRIRKPFSLVLYHSMDTDSNEKLSNIKVAATISNVNIYGIDMAYTTFKEDWFAKSIVNQNMLYPAILYVAANGVITMDTQPSRVQEMAVKFQSYK